MDFIINCIKKNLSAGIGPIGIWITGRDKAGNIYISGVDAASGVTDFSRDLLQIGQKITINIVLIGTDFSRLKKKKYCFMLIILERWCKFL